MDLLNNTPRRPVSLPLDVPFPSVDAARAALLVAQCPVAAVTPLASAPALAERAGIGALHIKDERDRMGLGSFKALGAAYVIACDAADGTAKGRTYVTASAGNHGMSVAAGAAAFGARAVVYIAETVPESFAERLRAIGAEVRRDGAIYEDSMAAALHAAEAEGFTLLSDSSWEGYYDRPHRLMEGYLVLMAEVIRQMPQPPTHLFLQAGVGGLACACATLARQAWGAAVQIVVVEPDAAPALNASVSAGKPVTTQGPASAMGRLDCKAPSLIALKGLARDADAFMLISEAEGAAGADACAAQGLPSTPSGAAGIAGLIAGAQALGLDTQARVLCILSEGPE
ncbi:pyridoxal-phosphate dependent enzyme [Pseudosulfitobacter koreensis]|uniref:Pyridoxal-phosphate dependent enzyme n=1 Tax=Pseudosulfitobacter koreensis TaxID=2968472 RepID=A0ABT1Z1S1_9RHOB|nr:pyridoxal-phosphate dependent enzyme [Pseudosulfitobacter koreense]MCR8827050.1 pyridoxal-phosphate dependent enzyme [Pseudosulfitobacter koreense]